jgi:hypothetical protein
VKYNKINRVLLSLFLFSIVISLFSLTIHFSNAITANFGETEIGVSVADLNLETTYLFGRWLSPYDGVLTSLSLFTYTNATFGSTQAQAQVYSDLTSHPNILLDTGNLIYIATNTQRWYVLTGLNVTVTHGTYYWLGVTVATGAEGDSLKSRYFSDASYSYESDASASNPWTGATVGTGRFSVYGTVENHDTLTYSNVTTNSTFMGSTAHFSTLWATNGSLSHYIFGWNYTGTFVNDTATAFSTMYSVTDKVIPVNGSMNGDVIQWQFWANNTGTTWNTTGSQAFNLTSGNHFFNLHGVYSETTGAYLGSCNVTAFFDGAASETIEVAGTRTVGYTSTPIHLLFDLSPYQREYWIALNENLTDIYIYNDITTVYVINFLDYTGLLQTYPYITVKTNINGVNTIIEKCKVDIQKSVSLALVEGRKYQIEIGDATTNYVYGDLLMTATLGIQLILRGVDFPQSSLLTQKYIHIYGVRNFTSPSGISIIYQDDENLTLSVDLSFSMLNGTVAYSTSSTAQSFLITWNGADNATTYYFTATIHSGKYGDLVWKQIFVGQGGGNEPFGMGWFGSLGFNTAYLFPAFLLLCVAGAFSALNAEVGAILVSIMAMVLTWMGWIPIPIGALITSVFLSFLMALIYNKRRVVIY